MSRKLAAILSCSLVLLLALSVAGWAGEKKKVTLNCWYLSSVQNDWLQPIAKKFSQEHPEYDFALETALVPSGQLAEKIIGTFIAGSGSPDLVLIQEWDMAKYIKGRHTERSLVDLRPWLSDKDLDDLVYEENWRWDGRYYALNIDMSLSLFYYRKDVFDEVGINPLQWTTYDDFIKAGLKLKEAKGAYMSVQDTAGWNQFLILAYQNLGGWFDKNGNNTLDSQENVEALQLWLDLVNKHKITWGTSTFYGPGTTAAQKEGKVVGVIIPEWYHAQFLVTQLPELAGKWRMAPLPRFAPGKPRTAHRGGTGMAISKSSKNIDVAWEFMKRAFMTVDGQKAKYLSPMGQFPSYKPAWKDPELLAFEFPYFGNQKTGSFLASIAPEVPEYYASPFKLDALSLINSDVLPDALSGKKTPKQALQDAKVKLDRVITRGY